MKATVAIRATIFLAFFCASFMTAAEQEHVFYKERLKRTFLYALQSGDLLRVKMIYTELGEVSENALWLACQIGNQSMATILFDEFGCEPTQGMLTKALNEENLQAALIILNLGLQPNDLNVQMLLNKSTVAQDSELLRKTLKVSDQFSMKKAIHNCFIYALNSGNAKMVKLFCDSKLVSVSLDAEFEAALRSRNSSIICKIIKTYGVEKLACCEGRVLDGIFSQCPPATKSVRVIQAVKVGKLIRSVSTRINGNSEVLSMLAGNFMKSTLTYGEMCECVKNFLNLRTVSKSGLTGIPELDGLVLCLMHQINNGKKINLQNAD